MFNPINSASIVEFLDIGWTDSLDVGILFGVDSIPSLPNESCVSVDGDGDLYFRNNCYFRVKYKR